MHVSGGKPVFAFQRCLCVYLVDVHCMKKCICFRWKTNLCFTAMSVCLLGGCSLHEEMYMFQAENQRAFAVQRRLCVDMADVRCMKKSWARGLDAAFVNILFGTLLGAASFSLPGCLCVFFCLVGKGALAMSVVCVFGCTRCLCQWVYLPQLCQVQRNSVRLNASRSGGNCHPENL